MTRATGSRIVLQGPPEPTTPTAVLELTSDRHNPWQALGSCLWGWAAPPCSALGARKEAGEAGQPSTPTGTMRRPPAGPRPRHGLSSEAMLHFAKTPLLEPERRL